jgi:quercetin dioxygenase-like cupin family protein
VIRKKAEVQAQTREAIRGGVGRALMREYIGPGAMAGVEFVSVLTLEPGASIGQHPHPSEEELYLILEGSGTGLLDGEAFPVSAGDAFLCKAGHAHGLQNSPDSPLTFLAVLSRANP